jgi:nucleotide-binding universal stress UspA family protein
MNATVLVPLDGSSHALVALPVARTLAAIRKATLHVVHVAEQIVPPPEIPQRAGIEPDQLHGSVLHGRAGEPAEAIVQLAAEHPNAMIAMCTGTGLPAPAAVLGPIAEQVLLRARCPVVLVRPERGMASWDLHTVLLPHDGTPTTSAAIRPAADLAAQAKAFLSVLHVATPGAVPPAEPGSLSAPRYVDQHQHEWPEWVSEFIGRFACICPFDPSRLRFLLGRGKAGEEVLRVAVAQKVDLIVLAWRGALEQERASVVKAVLREAPCPVMVVRAELGA